MNDPQIKAMVQQELQANKSQSRFGLNSIQRHTHNGVDSPTTFQPILNYIGLVKNDGVSVLLPKGWTSSHSAGGIYTITHNLGSSQQTTSSSGIAAFYSVIVQNQGNGFAVSYLNEYNNYFIVHWADLVATPVATSFSFTLTIINNRSAQLPVYTGSLVGS